MHSAERKYADWILAAVGDCRWELTSNGHYHMFGTSEYQVDGEPLVQRCDYTALAMAEDFKELKVVVGRYASERTGFVPMYHVWCVAPDGTIVDPTGRQFDTFGGPADSYKEGTYIPERVLVGGKKYI